MNNVVFEGWLTKSPPEKRIWKGKWRKRWFVLKQSGEIPGQYVLEYYTDTSRRKFKGRIDLDQCEQVDAGLELESRLKLNNQFMFDIRTSKRVYYLVAKTEIEMNKWVEYICSVCDLKIPDEEGNDDYRYSPQPGQEFASNPVTSLSSIAPSNSTVTTSQPILNSASLAREASVNSSSSTPTSTSTESMPTPNMSPTKSSQSPLEEMNNTAVERTEFPLKVNGRVPYEPSGPYIPISECHTGKPIMDAIPSVPLKSSLRNCDEQDTYDTPRQLDPCTEDDEVNDDILNKVPSAPCSNKERRTDDARQKSPPEVNWKTFPHDESFNSGTNRASTKSCSAALDSRRRTQSGLDSRRSSSPTNCGEFLRGSSLNGETQVQRPPPRPPKPESIRQSNEKSESCASLPTDLYDVPTSSEEVKSVIKNDELSPTSRVPAVPVSPSDGSSKWKIADDGYDFPKPCTELVYPIDKNNLNATVPVSNQWKPKQHSYLNGPPGFLDSKDSVFTYELRHPLIPSVNDSSYSQPNDHDQSDRSPLTPNSASYKLQSNYDNITPPAVNRNLKPRRKSSDSEVGSPTSPTVFKLATPPALARIENSRSKKCFIKSSTSHQIVNGTPPRIPSRGRQFQHHREHSTSEDDCSGLSNGGSRRNSANDSHLPPRQNAPHPCTTLSEFNEIQYLELDHESDTNSSSPRTPNEVHSKTSTLHRDGTSHTGKPASTVYKTVDFVKTEAFNKVRLDLEDTYRNS